MGCIGTVMRAFVQFYTKMSARVNQPCRGIQMTSIISWGWLFMYFGNLWSALRKYGWINHLKLGKVLYWWDHFKPDHKVAMSWSPAIETNHYECMWSNRMKQPVAECTEIRFSDHQTCSTKFISKIHNMSCRFIRITKPCLSQHCN